MKLWIDDLRPKPDSFDFHAYNYDQAIEILENNEITEISFDHDLSMNIGDKNGYDIAKWIEARVFNGLQEKFIWKVHSSNPVGAKNIRKCLRSIERM